MPCIFDEERRATGPIWPNLRQNRMFPVWLIAKEDEPGNIPVRGTRRISPLDTPMKRLKWRTLRRVSCLAGNKMRHASAATMNFNRP